MSNEIADALENRPDAHELICSAILHALRIAKQDGQ